jgi:hypothetical protein
LSEPTLYINGLIKRFNTVDCKPAKTPLYTNLHLNANAKEEKPNVFYQCLIGSMMYLAMWTRPDIAESLNYLSQFSDFYDTEHWKCAKRALRDH